MRTDNASAEADHGDNFDGDIIKAALDERLAPAVDRLKKAVGVVYGMKTEAAGIFPIGAAAFDHVFAVYFMLTRKG